MAQQQTVTAWRDLTWDDLDLWAGGPSLARGQEYYRGGLVRELAITAEGQLLAWVQGTQLYATAVELHPAGTGLDTPLHSRCSCPVSHRCKHAVAVILTYLDLLKKGKPAPVADEGDPRLVLLSSPHAQLPDMDTSDGDWDDFDPEADLDDETTTAFFRVDFAEVDAEEVEAEEDDGDEDEPAPPPRPTQQTKGKTGAPKDLRKHVEAKSQAWLVNFVLELAQRYPEVRDQLQEETALASDDMLQLIKDTRKEIRRRTGETAAVNHWTGEGNLPEYAGIKKRFAKLLAAKQYDALLELGQELFDRGTPQVETSDDEGETAMSIAECLALVFQAVPQAKLPPEEKLLYVIDLCLADDYSLCEGAHEVLEAKWPRAAWSAVADSLQERLRQLPRPRTQEDFTTRYERESLAGWVVQALERAGRADEVLPLCEKEARATGSYERLVNRLVQEDKIAEAEQWAREGITATATQYPGIAQNLKRTLRDLAEKRGDWPTVAGHLAESFFTTPSAQGYEELLAAATKAGHGPVAQAALRHFLETGNLPKKTDWPLPGLPATPAAAKGKKGKAKPTTELSAPPLYRPRPDVLLELAFREQQPEQILKWYDQLYHGRNILAYSLGYGENGDNAVRVADAVAATHPERSIAIYKERAAALVETGQQNAYQTAGQLLRKLRKVLSPLHRTAEWEGFVLELRTKHQRKRKFLEVLDRLKHPKIIEG